ncbi:NAD(P)/FAD-dependent oxidoreductase [Sphingobacterium sp.]|uniref:flavin monoamine oxidase family protein n=1 Tax=Sphingobacterium sp. TaxID=341027 RepID=UPI0028AAD171|nr:NAD(P)/FAD-dependent oxidoreductase [Sphingobacterium sp.]
MIDNQRIVIIGGGLSGLTLAYLLSKRNINAIILEASARLGGRIQTVKGKLQTPLELGATWFSDMHPNLLSLIRELGLQKYPQFSKGISLFQTNSFEPPQKFFAPETEMSSYRLVGGTQMLTDTLAQKLPSDAILRNTTVTAIKEKETSVLIETDTDRIFEGDKVIVCLPPQLISNNIIFSPQLPGAFNNLLPTVQTWMAGSIKFTLEYDQPFWRNDGYSGMLYSHAGIITEMYDHTSFEEDKFGFTGFLNGGAAAYLQEVRKELVLRQLGDLIGEKALNPTAYFDKVWTNEFILAGNQIIQHPHQDNGHPLLQQSYMNGNLYFAATETATQYPGYMEGAVIAARSVFEKLMEGTRKRF